MWAVVKECSTVGGTQQRKPFWPGGGGGAYAPIAPPPWLRAC